MDGTTSNLAVSRLREIKIQAVLDATLACRNTKEAIERLGMPRSSYYHCLNQTINGNELILPRIIARYEREIDDLRREIRVLKALIDKEKHSALRRY